MKIRISKKSNQILPANVAEKVKGIAADFSISTFNFETVSADESFELDEGHRFFGIGSDGRSAQFEVVSEHSLGARNLSHKIGERFKMPAGSYLILVYYYTRFFMTVYEIKNLLNS